MTTALTGPEADAAAQASAAAAATNQGNPTDWRTSLPDDLKSEKVFESIKGKDWAEAGPVLAKNYLNAQRMVGADKLVVPGPHATAEEKAAFYTKLGRPETPDKYTYKVPDGVKPEQLDKAMLDGYLKEMHEAGIPAAAADRLITKYLADEQARSKALADNRTKEIQGWELKLKQDLGAKFDEQLNYGKWALKEFGGGPDGELIKMLDSTGLGSHPAVVKFFASVGARMSDDKGRSGGGRFTTGTPTNPADAQVALKAFHVDPEKNKALFDRNHPGHEAAVKERMELFKAAYPSKSDQE